MAEKKADHEHKEINQMQDLLKIMLGEDKFKKLVEQAKSTSD